MAAAAAASVHAIFDRGVVAPVTAKEWDKIDCAWSLSGGACPLEGAGSIGGIWVGTRGHSSAADFAGRDETRQEEGRGGICERGSQDKDHGRREFRWYCAPRTAVRVACFGRKIGRGWRREEVYSTV